MPLLATVTPCRVTTSGSSGSTSWSRFCTCTCAMSGSVPLAKVSVIEACPLDVLVAAIVSRFSSPVMVCSITVVTEFSTVSALAPG